MIPPRIPPGGKWVGSGVAVCAGFLMLWEGYVAEPRHERVDPNGVMTWCYGRTNYDVPTPPAGTHFTKDDCKKFLEEDLQKYAAPIMKCMPGFAYMPPKRQAAVVSFGYNIGPERACKSTAIRQLNAGNVQAGCDAMMSWVSANGVVLKGLVNRRNGERALCLAED